ncbi:MAG TPA: large conductance mechanosensitive channel protein MscL [Ktedonobacterales bacterium]
MRSLFDEFKAFILRGNVIDLAVAVVIGAAFAAIITALVNDIISPLLASFGGAPNFDSQWILVINKAQFKFGAFLTAVVYFLIIAAIIFFLVIKPINFLMAHRREQVKADPTTRECPYCISVIPIVATRCAFCTQEVPAVAPVSVPAR